MAKPLLIAPEDLPSRPFPPDSVPDLLYRRHAFAVVERARWNWLTVWGIVMFAALGPISLAEFAVHDMALYGLPMAAVCLGFAVLMFFLQRSRVRRQRRKPFDYTLDDQVRPKFGGRVPVFWEIAAPLGFVALGFWKHLFTWPEDAASIIGWAAVLAFAVSPTGIAPYIGKARRRGILARYVAAHPDEIAEIGDMFVWPTPELAAERLSWWSPEPRQPAQR